MTIDAFATARPAIEMPPGVTGFGLAEVAYLLSRHAGPQAAKSRRLMILDELAAQNDFVRAGASSLVARGLMTRGPDGETVLLDRAAVLDFALANATTWTEIGIRKGDLADTALVVASPAVIAVLQPRALGTWFVSFVDGATSHATTVVRLLDEVRSQQADARFAVVVGDVDGDTDAMDIASSTASGAWKVDGQQIGSSELTARLEPK